MKTATRFNPMTRRSVFVAGTAAMLALAALVFAGQAEARDTVSLSIGIGVPGVQLGVGHAYPAYPVYQQPVYQQPVYQQPFYGQPRVMYQQPAPVYYQPPRSVYVQPQPVYVQPQVVYQQSQPIHYGRPHHGRHGGGGHYVQGPRHGGGHGHGFGRGAVPVYYGR